MPSSQGANPVRQDKDQEQQLENNAYQLKETNFAVAQLLIFCIRS
jgi:hypothetical protein